MERDKDFANFLRANEAIAHGARRILDQERRVCQLDREGHDTTRTSSLLILYRRLQVQYEAHRKFLLQRLRPTNRPNRLIEPSPFTNGENGRD